MTQTTDQTGETTTVDRATAVADADGARTDDGRVDVGLATAGQDAPEGATTPEHLMAAGLAGCLLQSLRIAASSLGQEVTPSVEAVVVLGSGGGVAGYSATFELVVSGLDGEHADDLLTQASTICPFTSALPDDAVTVRRA